MTPGAAASPAATELGSEQENESTIDQGDNHATGGNAEATGGNGGNADTGNTQEGNSNARQSRARDHPAPVSLDDDWKPPFGGGKSEAEAEGGNTRASSGNATGGNGGNANAYGGNANASNDAQVWQQNARPAARCPADPSRRTSRRSTRATTTRMAATPTRTGGNGGNADTGNTQEGNSNAAAFAGSPDHSGPPVRLVDDWKPPFGGGKSEAEAEGGNTSACSGDARGGNGGNAGAQGGNANASNDAQVHQQNSSVELG